MSAEIIHLVCLAVEEGFPAVPPGFLLSLFVVIFVCLFVFLGEMAAETRKRAVGSQGYGARGHFSCPFAALGIPQPHSWNVTMWAGS